MQKEMICLLKAKNVLFFNPKFCLQTKQSKREDVSFVFHIFLGKEYDEHGAKICMRSYATKLF